MSLSILLPIQNAQRILDKLLVDLLEVLPELTPRWRVLLMDRASRDATGEIAAEYLSLYPQMRWISQSATAGPTDDWRLGLRHSVEDFLLYRTIDSRAEVRDIEKLWRGIRANDIIVGRTASEARIGTIPPLPGRQPMGSNSEPGLQLVRRRVWDAWPLAARPKDAWSYLSKHPAGVTEVEVRTARAPLVERRPIEAAPTVHAPLQQAPAIAPVRGNYFSRLKRIASRS